MHGVPTNGKTGTFWQFASSAVREQVREQAG